MSTPRTPTATPLTPRRASKMASNQNLNHLLNFTLPPRQSQPQSLPRRSRKTANHGIWNRERFVNQYRFIMNPNGDYTVHFADPDMQDTFSFVFFQWQDILQVIIPRSSALASASTGENKEGQTTCPICLSPPTAPRMTKCGHVFCFPCILHYLNISESKWAQCPICLDTVNEKQLKAVKWYEGPPHSEDEAEEPVAGSSSSVFGLETLMEASPRPGSTMRLRLMQRPQITTLALPRSTTWPSDLLPPHQAPFHFLPDVFEYARFMLATPAYLVAHLTGDLDELASERRILSGMTDDLGVVFVDAAETKVRQQLAKAAALDSPVLQAAIDKALRGQHEVETRMARRKQEAIVTEDVPQELISARLDSPALTNTNRNRKRNVNPPPPSTSTYYYYQASSGLPIFLHPLDIKILLSHFNNYPAFPDTITIRVDASAEGTVNDDLRKRCKYLANMPEGADVVFVEADLSDVVGHAGLKNFEGPLKMRASRRKDKERKDERARIRAEEREKERDRQVASSIPTSTWRFASDIGSPLPNEVVSPPAEAEAQPPVAQGAWGARSFAAAANSTPTTSNPRNTAVTSSREREREEDEWDMDAAWHELETRISTGNGGGGGGGGKKRNNRMVVLGGGGPGGRRRR
ncbi:RING finger domain protein [Mycena indigotica]|uniref:RING finger domain protein n=1 Tax=Mycena indigotica TaxID=2126181 RepID=A0A8H6W6B1_9AGAR|nr:RING finger domain protein [Mycena indigotica]KAF7307439.1 RING finger domain protein [Mycena indigotica]